MCNEGRNHIVWPVGSIRTVDNIRSFDNTSRCGCNFQVSYGCPCAHEFAVMVKFDVNQYSKKWLCKQKFEELYPELFPSLNVIPKNEYSVSEHSIDENVGNKLPSDTATSATKDSTVHDLELPQHQQVNEEGAIRTNYERVTYNKLREITSELVTAVLHNKSQCNNVLSHLTEWVRKIRRK